MPSRWVSGSLLGFCLSTSAVATGSVSLILESPLADHRVPAGTTINWTIEVSVSTGDNLGLAQVLCDLIQDPGNPVLFDIPPGNVFSIPAAMANFDRPAGITQPGENCAPSSFTGLQRGTPGQMNLVQIGGAQNTSGNPLPPGTGMGENAVVTPGIGEGASPQLVLSGSFPAPPVVGTYVFSLQNAVANVLSTIAAPPQASDVSPVTVDLSGASFAFAVAPPLCRGDLNCDGQVSFADINPFVLYLSSQSEWQTTYPGCDPRNGDIDEDGDYPAFGDINPFVALLASTAPSIDCAHAAREQRAEVAAFSRASPAYLSDNSGVTRFADDEPRFVPVTLSTVTDGAVLRNEAQGSSDVIPQCQNSRYMFALCQGANKMYRTADGVDWQPITITSPPNWWSYWTYIFATAADSLLVVDTTSNPDRIYRSTDDGATWSHVLTVTPGSPSVTIANFGFYQAPNGTMILVEYAGPGVGTPYKVYRSVDDGQTWAIVHSDDTITHFHAVGYHAATAQWFVAHGDGVNKGILNSTDDGLTWQAFHAKNTSFAQPVWFQDIGDPGRIWLGADDGSQVAYLDVSPDSPGYKEVVPVVNSYDPRTSRGFTFLMAKHESVTYACNMDATQNTLAHYPVVVASLDGLHWATVHQFREPVTGLGYVMGCTRYAGFLGGKLHFACMFTGRDTFWTRSGHFAFSPSQLSDTSGQLLEPGVHNYLNATQSGCEHADGPAPTEWTKSLGTFVLDTANQHERSQSLHWYHDVPNSPILAFRLLTDGIADGKSIYFRCRFKGRARDLSGFWCDGWYTIDLDKRTNSAVGSSRECNWIEHVGLPTRLAAPANLRYALQLITLANADRSHYSDLWIDTLQAAEIPITTWQLGSDTTENDRASEHLTYSQLGLQTNWTYACRMILTNSPADLAQCSAPLYFFTIYRDACNYASVYYDPADSAIKLASCAYGISYPPLEAAALVGGARQLPLHVVVRHDAGQIRLSVATASPMENVVTSAPAALAFADTWLAGDRDGHNLMPMVLIDHVILPGSVASDSLLSQPDYFDQLQTLAAAP